MTCIYLDGAKISVAQTGVGEPVVLLHSSLSSGAQWSALSDSIADRFRAVMPDHYGCGRSDPWPGLEPFSLSAEAIALGRIARDLGEQIHLVGHSYEGALALHVACRRRSAIRSLTLVEPSAFQLLHAAGSDAHFAEISGVAAAMDSAVLRGDRRGATAYFVDYWNGAGAYEQLSEERRAKLVTRIAKVPLDFWAILREKTDLVAISRIDAPTPLVHGDRSPKPSLDLIEILAEALPNCGTAVIEGAGHMAPLTHARAVSMAVGKHLDALAPIQRRAA